MPYEPSVWVETIPHVPRRGEVVVVRPVAAYDSDLGMRTRKDVYRQLEADVPRCEVWVDGVRAHTAAEVWRRTLYPRLCTQAVLAPPVEWLLRTGWVAHEIGSPMVVECVGKTVEVRKRLGLWRHDVEGEACLLQESSACVDVRVAADTRMVVVSLKRVRGRTRP